MSVITIRAVTRDQARIAFENVQDALARSGVPDVKVRLGTMKIILQGQIIRLAAEGDR